MALFVLRCFPVSVSVISLSSLYYTIGIHFSLYMGLLEHDHDLKNMIADILLEPKRF